MLPDNKGQKASEGSTTSAVLCSLYATGHCDNVKESGGQLIKALKYLIG